MDYYELSEASEIDIEQIYNYTENNFGFEMAIAYLSDINKVLEKLIINPRLGRARTDIKLGLRSFPIQKHIVFYRLMSNYVRVVRILHMSKDLNLFKE